MDIDSLDRLHEQLTSAESKNERNHAHEEFVQAVIDAWPDISVALAGRFKAGAESMRDAAVKLCDSPDVRDIEEYADCIRALPLPEPPK